MANEAEIEEVLPEKKSKIDDFKIELILFFILGILLGITIKTEATKRITIGFYDYQLKSASQAYNASEIKKKLIEEAEKQKETAGQNQEAPAPSGDTCSVN